MFYKGFLVTLFAVLLVALSACEGPKPAADADSADSTVSEAEAPDATATEDAAPAEASTEAAVAEAADTVVETEGLETDTGSDAAIELESAAPAAVAETVQWKYKEGSGYRRMTASQGTSSAPDKIEVAEVFWYGCGHCYDFDPILEEWKQSVGPDVAFVRIPVIWNPTNQVHAKVMYTAEALGIMDQAHTAIFKAIHQGGNTLTTDENIVKFFSGLGVEEENFREVYNSFGVSSAVKRAENLTRRYTVRSVPLMVINGKYATDAPDVKSFGDMIEVTNELVERERREL